MFRVANFPGPRSGNILLLVFYHSPTMMHSPALAAMQANVQQIHDNYYAPKSKQQYLGHIRRFLVWLKQNSPESLIPAFQEMSDDAIAKIESLAILCSGPFPLVDNFSINIFEMYLTTLQTAKGKPLQASSLGSHRSSLHCLFHSFKKTMPVEAADSMKRFFRGKKRDFARAQANGLESAREGKTPISFPLYQYLCQQLLRSGETADIFSHTYLTLSWNLICRAGNTAGICYPHMEWTGDALGIYFPHQKNDQEGDRPKDPRHIYANPINPETCTILSLGIYWLCFGFKENGVNLFPGEKQYDRYLKRLRDLWNTPAVAEELKRLGIKAEELGTHSTRKGAATYVLSGTTACPSLIPLSLRCGWKLDGVTGRYLRYEAAGDQFVGRTVAGLPPCESAFATLPPFFIIRTPEVAATIDLCFPQAPKPIAEILEFALASVVYHSDFLHRTLPDRHPLFATALFRQEQLIPSLRHLIECRIPQQGDRIRATGLSPMTTVLQQISVVEKRMEILADVVKQISPEVSAAVVKVLEERSIQANMVTHTGLQQALQAKFEEFFNRLHTPPTPPPPPPTQYISLLLSSSSHFFLPEPCLVCICGVESSVGSLRASCLIPAGRSELHLICGSVEILPKAILLFEHASQVTYLMIEVFASASLTSRS